MKYNGYLFERFRGTTGWLAFLLVRLCLGIAAGAGMLISILPDIAAMAAMGAGTGPDLTLLLSLGAAVLGLEIAAVAAFGRRKKAFPVLYLVIAAMNVTSGFFAYQAMFAAELAVVEAAFCAYVLVSKNVAVRFGFYNPLNRSALDAYAVRMRTDEEREQTLSELEEAADLYRRSRIGPDEFAARKRALLGRL